MNIRALLPLRVQPAGRDDQVQALRLLFGELPPADRDEKIAQMVATATSQPLDGLWVAYRGEHVVGAVMSPIYPGRTAVISSPAIRADQPRATAYELLEGVLLHLSHSGVQLVQSLLETDHGADATLLTDLGFRHLSNLLYLVSVAGSFPTTPPNDGLSFIEFVPLHYQRLAEIVQRTYEGSLDCPEIDGIRQIDDVLAGYRANGAFDPARWLIVRDAGVDIGCLLLADHPDSNQWEVVYMGIVPEARGRGRGVAIARYAQWRARQAERARLVLAVDAANAPAIAMYAAAGFVSWDYRSVYLRIL